MTSHLPTDLAVEFYVNGAWTTSAGGQGFAHRLRAIDNDAAPISITRGTADQQGAVAAQSASFALNNRDGLFTDDNPNSPLYQQFGQNVRTRLGVKTSGTWGEFLRLPDYVGVDSGASAYTIDKASLDIVGDIDLRIEFSPTVSRNREMVLMSKYAPSNCSWILLYEPSGGIKIITSPDGTITNSISTFTIPVLAENFMRIAVRMTLDVDNGAGGHTYTFYTADTIAGPWTSFAVGTFAGTTSIFSGNGQVELGTGGSGTRIFTTSNTFGGRIYAAQVYSGIAGTLVADFNPVGKGLETTVWNDTCASPNLWVLSSLETRLSSDHIRVAGELITTPLSWDKTGHDVFVPVQLAGMLARYSANKAPFNSCLYRYWRLNSSLTDYWPCEDGSAATQASSAVTGGRPGQLFGTSFSSPAGIDGSTGALTLNTYLTSYAKFTAGPRPVYSGATTAVFYMNLAALPASEVTFATVYVTGGTVRQWRVEVGAATFRFVLVDGSGTTIVDSGSILFGAGASPFGQWVAMSLQLVQSGGNVTWITYWHAVGSEIFYTAILGGANFAGTCGQFNQVAFLVGDAAFAGAEICHVVLTHGQDSIGSALFADVSRAFAGELFGVRYKRLMFEESIPSQWRGDLNSTQAVGPQAADTLYNILASGVKVAGGLLADIRDMLGFEFVTQQHLGNRRGLQLDYSASALADVPLPMTDLRYLVNDFTATRSNGSSARYVQTDGRRNASDPPVGIGRWEQEDSFDAYADTQMLGIAGRQVFQGTWDERRIPNIPIGLHRPEIAGSALLLRNVIATDLGDPVKLVGMSASPLPPNDLLMATLGYAETINGFLWTITHNTVPGGPFQVPICDDYSLRYPRMDVDDNTHSVLNGAATNSATTIAIKTDATRVVKYWVDSTNYPAEVGGGNTFDVNIAGERCTVTSIAAPSLVSGFYQQTLTVTRSVNGIVKAHNDLDTVKLWSPHYLGME